MGWVGQRNTVRCTVQAMRWGLGVGLGSDFHGDQCDSSSSMRRKANMRLLSGCSTYRYRMDTGTLTDTKYMGTHVSPGCGLRTNVPSPPSPHTIFRYSVHILRLRCVQHRSTTGRRHHRRPRSVKPRRTNMGHGLDFLVLQASRGMRWYFCLIGWTFERSGLDSISRGQSHSDPTVWFRII